MKIQLMVACLIVVANCSIRPTTPVDIPEVTAVYDKPWYSGYLDFPFQGFNAHMHYFYFPSQSDSPNKDPLLFWFNGGPGCSSLLGALYEHGPFIYNDAFGFLMNNKQAWNKRANTVYIESPAQVGFSYMDIPEGSKYPTWNDDMVAELNLLALLEFFNTFPEFSMRPTYISGESYGGIYVPTLANKVHDFNQKVMTINLKGFAVGNGCTDVSECEFLSDYPHYLYVLLNDIGIVSDSLFQDAEEKCMNKTEITPECNDTMNTIGDMINGINIYDAFRSCWQNEGDEQKSFMELKDMALGKTLTFAPPCVDAEGINRLLWDRNNRKILGIPENVEEYSMCNDDEDFGYDRSTTGSYWVYQKLVPLNKYKIVIYSGDSDPAVPISGTFMWMEKIRKELGLQTQKYWYPWMTKTNNGYQNSGNLWSLSNGLNLMTFKGVGHMAPQWNNQGGTKLINYLLFDENP